MPKKLALAFALLVAMAAAQTQLSQQFTEFFNTAPPAVLNSATSSTALGTGVIVSSAGGSIAAGTYRVALTFFTATNTETTGSVDTAATATITTTGSTSTLTIVAPVSQGVNGSNVIGYRVYIGASGGASAAETLQTPTAANCTLSASSTPSCALGSNFVITSSTNFIGGGGAPATNTALTPPLSNAAATALFENSANTYRTVYWIVSGTAPGTCTIQFQTGALIGALANIGQSLTCTASGAYAVPNTVPANYLALNLSAFTPGDTTTRVAFYITSAPIGPPLFFGPAPTSACGAAVVPIGGLYILTTTGASQPYTCVTTTWTAMTLP